MAKIINPIAENEKILRLDEMVDAIEKSLANLEQVMNQQAMLIDVVEASDKKEMFEEFIVETKEQLENLESQKSTLLSRKAKLEVLLEAAKEAEKLDVILCVFDAFGIFE